MLSRTKVGSKVSMAVWGSRCYENLLEYRSFPVFLSLLGSVRDSVKVGHVRVVFVAMRK
jgi:hypothetical protein